MEKWIIMDKYDATYLFVGESEHERYNVSLPSSGIIEVFSADGVFIDGVTNVLGRMDHLVLTVVILVYNDAAALRDAVPTSVEVLEGLGLPFELILWEDASTDGSRKTAVALAAADDRIRRVNHSDVRRGKGGALSDALALSHGDIFCFYDVDLSTDLANLPALLEKILAGADIVVGSRFLAESTVLRSGDREATSIGFNRLVQMLLASSIRDHQCGFKAFRRERLVKLMPYVQARGWTWDTEVLALVQRCGYTIEEIPITRTHRAKRRMCEPVTSFLWAGRCCSLPGGYALRAGIQRTSDPVSGEDVQTFMPDSHPYIELHRQQRSVTLPVEPLMSDDGRSLNRLE